GGATSLSSRRLRGGAGGGKGGGGGPGLAAGGKRGPGPEGNETSRTQHSCRLWRPRSAEQGGCARNGVPAGPDTRSFPAPWPFKVRRAHLLGRGGQLGTAHGRGGSSGVSSLPGALRRGAGGPRGGGSGSNPAQTRQPRPDLACSPTPPPPPGPCTP